MRRLALALLTAFAFGAGIASFAYGQAVGEPVRLAVMDAKNTAVVFGFGKRSDTKGRSTNARLYVQGTQVVVTADEAVNDGRDLILSGNVRLTTEPAK
jgi:hypothetical protein